MVTMRYRITISATPPLGGGLSCMLVLIIKVVSDKDNVAHFAILTKARTAIPTTKNTSSIKSSGVRMFSLMYLNIYDGFDILGDCYRLANGRFWCIPNDIL